MNNQVNPRIIFFGTPEIAVPILEEIHKQYGIIAVVTNPDKEQGRGKKLLPSEVKVKAMSLGISVLEPIDLKSEEFYNELNQLNADIFVVFAFKILPNNILELPKLGSFNIHPSLLPKYRGAAPINHSIINGDKITGITTFLMEQKVDSGNILIQEELPIPEDSTAGDLQKIVMQIAPEIAIKTINLLIRGDFQLLHQDNSLVTKASKLFKENCQIDFNQDAEVVKNFINGVSPEPAAWLMWNNLNYKILRARKSHDNNTLQVGEYLIQNKKILIGCLHSAIEVLEIQPPTKKVMNTKEFINGYKGDIQGYIT
jgi:methionyl-tRNA formyltransferase